MKTTLQLHALVFFAPYFARCDQTRADEIKALAFDLLCLIVLALLLIHLLTALHLFWFDAAAGGAVLMPLAGRYRRRMGGGE